MERTIELRQHELGSGIAHYYWVYKEGDEVKEEIHGWPVYKGTGKLVPIEDFPKYFGRSDLKFLRTGEFLSNESDPLVFRASSGKPSEKFLDKYATQITLSSDEIASRWHAMTGLEPLFNDVNEKNPTRLPYWLLSQNSNSMAYSVGIAGGFQEYLDNLNAGPETAGFRFYLQPGWRKNLLPNFYDYPIDIPEKKPEPRPDLFNETRYEGQTRLAANRNDTIPMAYRGSPSDAVSMTPAAARRAIEALKANAAFRESYVNNDRGAVGYMHALHRVAHPEPVSGGSRPSEPDASEIGGGRETRQAGSMAPTDSANSGNGLTPWMKEEATAALKQLNDLKLDRAFVDRYLDGDKDAFDHMQSVIRAAFPEPASPDRDGSGNGNGASSPTFQPWTPETATEGLAPWMQSSLKDYMSRSPDDEGDGSSTLASWMRDQYPDWLRGS